MAATITRTPRGLYAAPRPAPRLVELHPMPHTRLFLVTLRTGEPRLVLAPRHGPLGAVRDAAYGQRSRAVRVVRAHLANVAMRGG